MSRVNRVPVCLRVQGLDSSDEQKRKAAVDQLASFMPQIAALLADAGAPAKAGRK